MKTKLFCVLIAVLILSLATTSCNKKNNETNYYGTISGTVIEDGTENSIEMATVTLSPSGKNTYTSNDGHFEFNNLYSDQYTMTVQKTGYETNRKTVTLLTGETEIVSIPLKKIQ